MRVAEDEAVRAAVDNLEGRKAEAVVAVGVADVGVEEAEVAVNPVAATPPVANPAGMAEAATKAAARRARAPISERSSRSAIASQFHVPAA